MTIRKQNRNIKGDEALRASELNYRRLFEAAEDGILILDVETGRINEVNPFLCKLLGFSQSEMVGKTVGEMSPFTDVVTNRAMLERLQKDGHIRYENLPLETKDGREIAVEFVCNVYQAGDKKVIQCNIRDIRQRKKAEVRLNLLDTCLANLNEIVLVTEAEPLDEPGPRIVFVNRAFERLTGYTSAETLGRSPRFLQGEKTDRRILAEIRQALVQRQPIRRQIVNYKKDGTPCWMDTDIAPIFDASGKCTHFAAIKRDITEEKITAEQLLWKTAFFEAQVNSALDGILVVDGEGKTIFQNQQLIDLWNIPGAFAEGVKYPQKLDRVSSKVKHSRQFLEKVVQIYGQPDAISRDEIELINGTCLDRYSAPVQGKDGKNYGRIWSFRDITERKKAEEVRRTSDARFRRLVDSNAQGVIFWNTTGQITGANDAFLTMVGYTRQELEAGRINWAGMTPPQYANLDLKNLAASAATGKCVPYEMEYIRRDGSRVPVLLVSATFEDNRQEGVSFVLDITERKRSESRFRRLVDSNAQSVFFYQRNGRITGANNAFLKLVGYTREDLEAGLVNWKNMTPPEYADRERDILETLDRTGVCGPYEKEYIRKDGTRVPILIGKAAFEDNPDEGVVFVLDLTERKRVDQQVVEQAALLDEAQDAIIVRDLEGNVFFWNKGAERIYGWKCQEVLGLNVRKLLFRNPKRFAEVNALTINQGKWSGDLQQLTKDEQEITVEARWTLIRDDEGQPKSVLSINTDVTAKKKIETQFMRAQRMESIGTLASGIAHDLNNILSPILMSIYLLKNMSKNSKVRQILETIELSAQRGADIVRQVLSFAGGLDGKRIEIQPKDLLKDILNIIKDTFPKDIRFSSSVPNNTWAILGDPTQLHQILLNLCVNARDAMPRGGSLTIGVENCLLDEHYAAMNIQAKPGDYVKISVTDTGEGIPPDVLVKIFEPFFTTKAVGRGTGLGLSTLMAIVKGHEGFVNVFSEPGKGSTFKVYLPAINVSSKVRKKSSGKASLSRGNGETILVVDDEAPIRTITSQTLRACGYQVLTATDGAKAMAVYVKHGKKIALVLTDMSMPIMDGASVIRALTKLNPAIKIIAASGLNDRRSVARVSRANIKHFLPKPYTAATLLKTIRAVLDKPSPAKSAKRIP
jgi:PAS domain S-box-containing protein